MTIETKTLTVSGIKVEVVRKDIKNLHLGVPSAASRCTQRGEQIVADNELVLKNSSNA